MKTRKVILNDDGKPMTKKQAERAARDSITRQVFGAYASAGSEDDPLVEVAFDGPVEEGGDVTLGELLALATSD